VRAVTPVRPAYAGPVLAILPSLGWQEMFLLLVIGLLLYGRNLPDAGRSLGRIVAQLKRSFHDFKSQLDREGELRDVKQALQDTAREVKNAARVPMAMADPGRAARDLAREAMTLPPPEPAEGEQTDGQPAAAAPAPDGANDEHHEPDRT
jgi:sec-independent protein translocase protein TatA